MENHSKSVVEVKAEGTRKGADEMMKYEAIGSMLLKIMGGIGIVLGGIAAVIMAVGKSGAF